MNISNNEDLLTIVQSAPIGICILDAATLVSEMVNDSFLEVAGKPYDAIYGKYYWDSFAEAAPYYEAALANVVREGKTYRADEVEMMLIRNGKQEWVHVTFVYEPVKDKDGVVHKVAVWVLENTLQVKSRQVVQQLNEELSVINEELSAGNEELLYTQYNYIKATQQSEKDRDELKFTIAAAGLGTFDLDLATNRFAINNLLALWSGTTPGEEISLETAVGTVADYDQERLMKAVQQASQYESGGLLDVEYTIINKQNFTPRVVVARGRMFFDETGRPERLSGVIQDITEQRKDEQRKNDFIGMVSHEMKTPLTSLSGYLQLMQVKANKEDAFTNNLLLKANNQIGRITKLINGFLNVSRLESGKINIDRQRFNMADLVKESEQEALSTINTHKIVFFPVETTWVYADRDKINQVITNLINNATKYSPANTEINVACQTIDGFAVVSVRDAGIGIKDEDQPKIFDRYYRVSTENMVSASGFGIGLYLCSEIIQRHDGKIWVESTVGEGSTFSFRLPVVE